MSIIFWRLEYESCFSTFVVFAVVPGATQKVKTLLRSVGRFSGVHRGAKVTYAASGKIAELVTSPLNDSVIKSRNAILSRESVYAVIDELVVMSDRGEFIIGGIEDIICESADDCMRSSVNYQKVTIYYNSSAKQAQVTYAVVQWKKSSSCDCYPGVRGTRTAAFCAKVG